MYKDCINFKCISHKTVYCQLTSSSLLRSIIFFIKRPHGVNNDICMDECHEILTTFISSENIVFLILYTYLLFVPSHFMK